MNLYWVTTEDHDEDWFVMAHDPDEAADFHEKAEGYDKGMAMAEWVMEISDPMVEGVGWPSHDTLRSCGAKFLREETPRVIEIGARKFCEGMLEQILLELEDNLFEKLGQGRPNKTDPGSKN